MVVDCGGGTVDITVHEMTSQKGHLLELYKAAGGPYGSVGTFIIIIIIIICFLAYYLFSFIATDLGICRVLQELM